MMRVCPSLERWRGFSGILAYTTGLRVLGVLGSPEASHTVAVKNRVGTNYRNALHQCLSDE